MLSDFWLSFIPLFIAFDVFGVLPLYIKFTHRLNEERRKRNLRDSLLTAFFTALLFVILGSKIMEYLGISIKDFLVAGGIVLFIISIASCENMKRIATEAARRALIPLFEPTGPLNISIA